MSYRVPHMVAESPTLPPPGLAAKRSSSSLRASPSNSTLPLPLEDDAPRPVRLGIMIVGVLAGALVIVVVIGASAGHTAPALASLAPLTELPQRILSHPRIQQLMSTGDSTRIGLPGLSDAPHPILPLLLGARAAWSSLLSSQPKSLSSARKAYSERYAPLNPPPGFDQWYHFARARNFAVVKAYQYSDLLSCELIDAWATPVCMVVAYFLVKARYHWTQYLGVLICIAGLGLLVVSDFKTDKNYPAANKPLGDGLMVLGATLYGVSNGLQEYLVRKRPLYEVIGQLGFWGTIINGVQAAAIEHDSWHQASWNGSTIGLLIGYTFTMLALYTCAPLIYRLASAVFYNISILSSDFFGLLIGLRLYHFKIFWLYPVAYVLVLSGLIVYFSFARPEDQGENVVIARGKQAKREDIKREQGGKIRVLAE